MEWEIKQLGRNYAVSSGLSYEEAFSKIRDLSEGTFTFLNSEYNIKQYRNFTPDKVANVEFYPPAVKMTFVDDTVITASAQEDDEFNPETGMTMCILKYIFGDKTYNNFFRKWIRTDEKRKKDKEKAAEQEVKEKELVEKRREKAEKRKQARITRKKNEQIEIMTEAMKRAGLKSKKGFLGLGSKGC